jgi:hypothetical protein
MTCPTGVSVAELLVFQSENDRGTRMPRPEVEQIGGSCAMGGLAGGGKFRMAPMR